MRCAALPLTLDDGLGDEIGERRHVASANRGGEGLSLGEKLGLSDELAIMNAETDMGSTNDHEEIESRSEQSEQRYLCKTNCACRIVALSLLTAWTAVADTAHRTWRCFRSSHRHHHRK